MALLLSAASLITGTILTLGSDRFPARRVAMERCSGAMIVGGLALIGSGLPLFR